VNCATVEAILLFAPHGEENYKQAPPGREMFRGVPGRLIGNTPRLNKVLTRFTVALFSLFLTCGGGWK
jgi:hypothetical protein